MYTYYANVEEVIDGDTIDVNIDLGFSIVRSSTRIRLARVDTHETFFVEDDSEEYRKGMQEKKFVVEWFKTAKSEYNGEYPIKIKTEKDKTGKYGRYIAEVERKNDMSNLSDDLIDEFGNTIKYNQ